MSAAATDASKLTEDEADELVMIVNLVRERSAWGPVSLDVVRETIGVNLQSRPALMDQLRRNPRIEVGMDGSLSFRRPFDIRDPEDILTVLRRHPHGVAEADVLASGPAELREAVATLVAEGRLIRMRSIDGMRSNVLFPRLNPLVVELPVTVEVASGQQWLTPSTDMTSEVNRGDLLLIGQVPRRVSTETRNGGLYTRSLHAERTGAQDSAAPLMPHTVRDSNPYTEAFTASRVPLDRPLPDLLPSGQRIDEKAVTVSVARIGLSSDLRSLWRDVRENSTRHFGFTYPTDHTVLRRVMAEHGAEPGPASHGAVDRKERAARIAAETAADKAVRAKRVRARVIATGQSEQNRHIEGTAAGAAVERARLALAKRKLQQQLDDQQRAAEAARAATLAAAGLTTASRPAFGGPPR